MISCPLCTKTFKDLTSLDHHIVSHTKEKPYNCRRCPAAFGVERNLKQHIKSVHHGIKQMKTKNHYCPHCSYKCYSKTMLQAHVRKHSAELKISCNRSGCGFKTKYKCALSQHALQAHSDERPFQCPVDPCSYKAKTSGQAKTHLRTHSNEKPFSCTVPECNFTCKSKQELKSHTSRAHSDEKPFKCSVCNFRTKGSQNLRLHEVTHTGIKRFQCQAPNCGFGSHQRHSLKVHFDRKHRTNKVRCTEPRCNFRCSSIVLLKLHLKRHKLPFLKCPSDSCGFRTKSNNHLLKHISSHHNDFQSSVMVAGTSESDVKTASTTHTMQCSFTDCSFQTKFRQLYTRHVRTHNKEEKGQRVCPFCFSRFNNLSLLKAHVKIHIREKPYSCSQCTFTTMESQQLKRHARKIHSIHIVSCGKDDEVGKCRTCGRIFFSYGESVLHSMSHLQPVVVLDQLKLHVL